MHRLSRRTLLSLILLSPSLAACNTLNFGERPTPTPTLLPNTPTPLPTLTPAPSAIQLKGVGRIEADAMAAGRDPKNPKQWAGSLHRFKVEVEKNPGKELRVGFFEDAGGEAGRMWRASGWVGVITSGFMLGIDPSDYRYSFEMPGNGDGPSAGALMTIATTAALLGDQIKPEATMTGTINPDGTVGPVGGIPHKIDGAAEKKKSLVLIPTGLTKSMDFNLRKEVDVIERGKNKGIEVKEVTDIYQAYKLLTGNELPRLKGMEDTPLNLASAVVTRTSAKSKEWLDRFAENKKRLEALPSQYQNDVSKRVLETAKRAAEKAGEAEQNSLPGARYGQAITAGTGATMAYSLANSQKAYTSTGMGGAINALKSLKADKQYDAIFERLDTLEAKTLGDVVALSTAYGYLSLAMGMNELGDWFIDQPTRGDTYNQLKLAIATAIYVMSNLALNQTTDALDIGLGLGRLPVPEMGRIKRLAELFRNAADANLKYVETVVRDDSDGETPADTISSIFIFQDLTYVLARSGRQADKLMEKRTRLEAAKVYATLGNGLISYVQASLLVARYYSLGTRYDKEGKLTGLRFEGALQPMLDVAERRAKEMVALTARIDNDLPQPLLALEAARTGRNGTLEDKFNALGSYWTAALYGQLIGVLTDQAKVSRA